MEKDCTTGRNIGRLPRVSAQDAAAVWSAIMYDAGRDPNTRSRKCFSAPREIPRVKLCVGDGGPSPKELLTGFASEGPMPQRPTGKGVCDRVGRADGTAETGTWKIWAWATRLSGERGRVRVNETTTV